MLKKFIIMPMLESTIAIFIPGYYGTTLQDEKSGRLIWGDTKEVLFGRKTLALPIEGLSIPEALSLKPFSMINDKKILGGLIREDAYDKSISLLNSLGVEKVFPLPWDWRRDPYLGIKALDELVDNCKKNYPRSKLVVVSHSFGSLIASYYLRYGAIDFSEAGILGENWKGLKNIDKFILSACPFRGLMAMFRNMHYGIKFGLNHKMQTALAFSTWESSYYLLPPAGMDLVQDEKGTLESLKLHDPNEWQKNKFGLFHESSKLKKESESNNEIRFKFVEHHLGRARKLHTLIESPIKSMPDQLKPILYLSGGGQKTVHHGLWLKKPNVFLYYPQHFKKWKVKLHPSIVFGEGDATVPDFSLKLPSFLKELNTIEVSRQDSHLNVLQSDESQQIISKFLLS